MSSAASAPSFSHCNCEKTREQLILAVQSHPCLWNTSTDSYHITGAKQNAREEVEKQCGCQGEYLWHGRSVSILYALTDITWSSAVINGPHDIVVLSFQCKCAWALGKLYVKSIAERGIKVWKPSLVWLLSTTGNVVYMMQSVSLSQLYNLKSMCYFKCNETVFLYYCDLNFSKFIYISQNIIQSWTCNRQRFVCIPWKRTALQDTWRVWFR